MAKVLDLNSVESSIMDLTLQDENRTTLHLDFPTEALVRELEQLGPELKKIEQGDRSAVDMIYDLAAKLISCNFDYVKVTAEELRSKYRMSVFSAIKFFSAYIDFINELNNQKN